MEKVVYVLGAGFSAPLGLPVVSNFRVKSQDMYLQDRKRYKYFETIYDELQKMAVATGTYKADLYNIEEILSLLEMGDFLDAKPLKPGFIQYLKDVIERYTPEMVPYANQWPPNWDVAIFPGNRNWDKYCYFVAALLNLTFTLHSEQQYHPLVGEKIVKSLTCCAIPDPPAVYGIVTLNYDLIPETVLQYCQQNHHPNDTVNGFSTSLAPEEESASVDLWDPYKPVALAKLHGSLDTTIVPPTWSKGTTPQIVPAWKLAHRLLSEATQIRIVGFSLPVGDAYIKYLFKSAALNNRFIKHIDVICMDKDGSVRSRYDEFISFRDYRFVDGNTLDYLEQHRTPYTKRLRENNHQFLALDGLEESHHKFMTQLAPPA